MGSDNVSQRTEQAHELQMKHIEASIEEMRINTALATKKLAWYVPILVAALLAGVGALAFKAGELYATLESLKSGAGS